MNVMFKEAVKFNSLRGEEKARREVQSRYWTGWEAANDTSPWE